MALDQGLAAVIGAGVGALAGIVGFAFAGWRQSKLETEKWSRAREDKARSDTRNAVADLAKTLASTAHSMMWVSFKVITAGKASHETLASFEVEFHAEVSDLVGAQMTLAALDFSLYEKVTPLVGRAIDMGANTYAALKAAMEKAPDAEDQLKACNQDALNLIKEIPKKVAGLLSVP
ncbi:hypothetical protein QTH97_12250 [Variovorax sp. J22R24]|uniref:hypothetical protein n=1 Tax=Variovorax gracilis TaxID=3053502 RepID=UPI002577BE36|nr:hypothetical protein [Variovorax sp. J22R24]MDM0105711.1 hypothetical protein [Variovorax sp. J22R24]